MKSFPSRSAPLALVLLLASCGSSGGTPLSDAQVTLRYDAAVAIATNVIVPTIVELDESILALDTAIAAWAAAPDDSLLRDQARTAWRATMRIAERLELMQVGPAGAMTLTPGGRSLRDEIYSWPVVSRCRVDEETAAGTYADVDTFAATLVNVRGLGAMEHLLFAEGTGHACAAEPVGWAAAVPELSLRRARYAQTLATLLARATAALRAAWDPTGGNYLGEIQTAGTSSTLFPSAQEALNAISDAMFYLDTATKDMKLATPAGVSVTCTDTGAVVCPDLVESLEADASFDHVEENLVAFRALFTGGAPGSSNVGFDDVLVSLGQEAIAIELVTEIDQAIAAAGAFVVPLEQAVLDDRTSVLVLYDEVKDVTDLWKTQIIALLDLEPPANAAGDND